MSDLDSDPDAANAAAMAAAMGFSGFGAQSRPSKKRRFNPRADAATTSTSAAVPVPPELAAVKGSPPAQRLLPLLQQRDPGIANASEGTGEEEEGGGGGGDSGGRTHLQAQPDGSVAEHRGSEPRVVAAAPGAGRGSISSRGPPFHGSDGGGGSGHRNTEWYIGYYDRSSNENPWAELEAKMGLKPVGSWLGPWGRRDRGDAGGDDG